MEHKLTDITKSFHSFAKDQVLTEKQLNEFLDYFDEQDRLSRICLSGVGIVCGFDVTTNEVSKEITISKGAGITTDGDLVNFYKTRVEGEKSFTELVNGLKFTHYRTFHGEKVNYDPQFDTVDGDPFNLIPLIELVPEGENSSEDKLLNLFPSLDKQVILIYIESYEKDRDNCVGVDCENQGIEQVNKLRVLMVGEDYVERITKPDSLFQTQKNAIETFLDQYNVDVPRVILSKESSSSAPALAGLYYSGKFSTAIQPLKSGLNLMLSDPKYNEIRDYVLKSIDEIFNVAYDNLVFFQYRYDFLKDLVDSYYELKEAYLDKGNFCCPNINAFPKHLLLGNPYAKKFKEQDNSYVNEYRHTFFKSPILETNTADEKFDLIAKRIDGLCKSYRRRRYFDADLLKITPSNVRVPLGKRAIPYYYGYSTHLMKNWDFQRRNYNQYLSILGYSQAINSPTNLPIATPLNYSIDAYDFFRIEGHQGLSYEDALKSILDDKNKYSLPFDVKVLGISVLELDGLLNDQYKCAYRDLEVLLNAWASEQECISSEVAYILSSFSTKEQGANLVEKDFYQIVKSPVKVPVTRNPTIPDNFKDFTTNEDTVDPIKSLRVTVKDNTGDFDRSVGLNTNVDISGDLVRGVRPPSNVEEFINKDVNSLGYLINDSIEQAKGNYDSAFAIALNNADVAVSNWDQILATSTIKLPLKIIFSVTKLASLIPSRIEDLSDSTLEDYNAEIAKLCSYTKQLQNQFRSSDNTFIEKVTTDTRGMVSLLINQLTTICCSAKKMQSLLMEVESRKESVLSRLDFSRFVAQNPGLEHKGGVGPGQTFVMVYVNSAITNRSKEDFVFSEGGEIDELPSRRRASQIIPRGTVIADFTLPYMCCSDCESVNFVLPKIPVELSLNSDSYCIDNNDLELEFTVVPQDGIITVVDSVAGVVIEDNKLRIDGDLFPTDLLGTKLKFKVNSEKTDLELLVSKRPSIEINVSETQVGSRNVSFSITGDEFSDYKYLWNFGDGNTSSGRNPTHQYALSDKSELFNVNLTVTPGAGICPTVISEEISFEGVVITIDAGPYCENDEPINIDITPKGANPVIVGAGVSDDGTQFIPALAGPGVHQLFFNNVLIQTITVNPVARISDKISINEFDDKLNLSVAASDATDYVWTLTLPNNTTLTFNDKAPGIPLTEFSTLKSGDIVKIEVEVSNGCGKETTTIDYVMPDVANPSATIPTNKFCVENTNKVNFTTVNFTAATVLAIDDAPVTSNPLSFVPSQLSVGVHNVSIDGVFQYSFVVGKQPGGYIDTSIAENSYIFQFVQDSDVSIDKMVWQFFDEENASIGEIRPAITGKPTINVPYDSFSSSSWSKLRVILKMDNQCGSREISTVVDAPSRSVKVTLPDNKYVYCSDDQGSYEFLFSPDTGDTVLNGKGVFGKVFKPYKLNEGNTTIFVSNGPDISVRIVDPNVGAADGPVYDPERGTLALKFVPRSSAPEFKIQWEVYRSKPGDIPGATSQELNYLVPIKELGIKESETIQIRLTKDVTYCGVSSTIGQYTIPLNDPKNGVGTVEPQKCDELFVNGCNELKNAMPTKAEQEYLTSLQIDYTNDILKIIDFGLEKPNDVISGANNDQIFAEVTRLLSAIKKAALTARDSNVERFKVLMSLYEILLLTYANTLRCQENLKDNVSLLELSSLIEAHFDPDNSSSFPRQKIDVIGANKQEQLNAFVSDRDTSVEPWRALLIVVLNDLK